MSTGFETCSLAKSNSTGYPISRIGKVCVYCHSPGYSHPPLPQLYSTGLVYACILHCCPAGIGSPQYHHFWCIYMHLIYGADLLTSGRIIGSRFKILCQTVGQSLYSLRTGAPSSLILSPPSEQKWKACTWDQGNVWILSFPGVWTEHGIVGTSRQY